MSVSYSSGFAPVGKGEGRGVVVSTCMQRELVRIFAPSLMPKERGRRGEHLHAHHI
jgi:hypothetical protein